MALPFDLRSEADIGRRVVLIATVNGSERGGGAARSRGTRRGHGPSRRQPTQEALAR